MTTPLHGVLSGRLQESLPGRIVVGGQTFFLRDGQPCPAKIGQAVQVVFTEQDGRREVKRIITQFSGLAIGRRGHDPRPTRRAA